MQSYTAFDSSTEAINGIDDNSNLIYLKMPNMGGFMGIGSCYA